MSYSKAADYKAQFAQCRLTLSVMVATELKGSVIPALEKVDNPKSPKPNYFEHTQNTAAAAFYFPPAGAALPFVFLADILVSPIKAIGSMVEKQEYKKELKTSKEQFLTATEKFKKEWEKIEPNPIKRHLIINQLYVLSIVSEVHSWMVNENAIGTVDNRRKFDFLLPYIYKNLGQEQIWDKKNAHWQIKSVKRGTTDLYMYFHLQDFREILSANPRLCEAPGLDALEVIGAGYAKIIKNAMTNY